MRVFGCVLIHCFSMGICCAQTVFSAMTKIVGTLGLKSRSVEIISGCLKAGMSGIAPFIALSKN